jgi:choline dehydrogenase-like flavoprotein
MAAIPERGAPPVPDDFDSFVHRGPAAEQGAVPTYLLGRGPVPEDGETDSHMEVLHGDDGGARDVEESCDVVIVGSGAGGASLARELAERGARVIVLEEGDYFTSKDFTGPPIERMMRFCRDAASTTTVGKVMIPVPIGRTVGGTTTVNSGTCFRTPRKVLSSWQKDYGLEGIDYHSMEQYFRRVESIINVRPVPWDLLGPTGWLTHMGAAAVGASGGPILRNITDCHGAGQCAFGCPTDAKQAMHLSYLPRACRAGARIYARTKAEWVTLDRGRAAGISARFLGPSGERLGRLHVKARAVAVAAGAIGTPVFLLGNRIANRSGQVGRNLRIHPATGVAGWFADPIYGWRGTLQPYYVDTLWDSHDVMLEATNSVPSVSASVFPGYGPGVKEIIANFAHIATLGLLVSDTSKGRVRRIPGGDPLITYSINSHDTHNIYAGLAHAAEIMLAAGAFSVTAALPGLDSITDEKDVAKLREGSWGPSALKLSAYHPMGTARMGSDPGRSVVDGNLESHDVPGLFVTDASVFPSCLGVNPQVTIMAFSTRCAEHLSDRLL